MSCLFWGSQRTMVQLQVRVQSSPCSPFPPSLPLLSLLPPSLPSPILLEQLPPGGSEKQHCVCQQQQQLMCEILSGFGDSTGEPIEAGFTSDTIYLYNWVKARCGDSLVVIWGHSLGTGSVRPNSQQMTQHIVAASILDAPSQVWAFEIWNFKILANIREFWPNSPKNPSKMFFKCLNWLINYYNSWLSYQ